ncbi:hypothetical protein AOLI_G00199700 [Acnodon oligacanthus]
MNEAELEWGPMLPRDGGMLEIFIKIPQAWGASWVRWKLRSGAAVERSTCVKYLLSGLWAGRSCQGLVDPVFRSLKVLLWDSAGLDAVTRLSWSHG